MRYLPKYFFVDAPVAACQFALGVLTARAREPMLFAHRRSCCVSEFRLRVLVQASVCVAHGRRICRGCVIESFDLEITQAFAIPCEPSAEILRMADWKKRARDARNKLKHAKHGEREAVLRRLAGDNDPNTVRRAIFALSYLDEFKQLNPSGWEIIANSPLSLVESLARWNSFDPTGAMKAAQDVIDGRYNVADLRKAVQKARAEVAARTESLPYRDRIRSEARRAVQELLGGNISAPEIGFKDSDNPPLDFRFLRSFGRPSKFETVAVIIVGPYRNTQLYRKRKFDWLYRAFGLAWFYDHVVILLPDPNEVESYREWISKARRRAMLATPTEERERLPSVHVFHPKLEPPPALTDDHAATIHSFGSLSE
jgi:hypothetical protein